MNESLTSLFIAWSKCDHIFSNPAAFLKRALFYIFGVDTAVESILGCFLICICLSRMLLLFLTILKLLLKNWYLMRLFGRTMLVVLRQKSVMIWVSTSIYFRSSISRVETINGSWIHRKHVSYRLLLRTYICTHHQQAWLPSSRTCERCVILPWLHYYTIV